MAGQARRAARPGAGRPRARDHRGRLPAGHACCAPTSWSSASTSHAPWSARRCGSWSPCTWCESRRRVGVTVRPTEEWNVFDPQVIRWRLAGPDRPRQLRSLTVAALGDRTGRRRASPPSTPPPEQCAELTEHALGMVATSRGQQLAAYLVHDVAFHRVILQRLRQRDVRPARRRGRRGAGRPHPAPGDVHRPRPGRRHPPRPGRRGGPRRATRRAPRRYTREITVGALRELDILAP